MLLNEPTLEEKKGSKKATSLIIAIAVHVIILLIAGLIIVLPRFKDEPEIIAKVVAPVENTEIKMEQKQVVKQAEQVSASAAASPIAKMIRAQTTAKIAAPEVTKVSDGPIGLGEGDFGSGFGNGSGGGGAGSGASFFGGKAAGNRFLFILDHSKSMSKEQVDLRNKELERSLKAMNNVQYQVLLFAGPAWPAMKGWEGASSGKSVKGPKKSYGFKSVGGAGDWEFNGEDKGLPTSDWLPTNGGNIKKTMDYIKGHGLVYGTDWELAFRTGHMMTPPPDVIFFMADGTGGNSPPPILEFSKKHGSPEISTVAMQTSAGAAQFNEIAKKTGGMFTIVGKDGKPISGKDFMANPGQFSGKVDRR